MACRRSDGVAGPLRLEEESLLAHRKKAHRAPMWQQGMLSHIRLYIVDFCIQGSAAPPFRPLLLRSYAVRWNSGRRSW